MPRGIFNWTFGDVTKFLKSRGFRLNNTRGSHHYYAGIAGGIPRHVSVQLHGRKTIKPKTMKSIIDQSGIPKEEWFK